jgi:beta-glucosidase
MENFMGRLKKTLSTSLQCAAALVWVIGPTALAQDRPLFEDPNAPAPARAADLVSRLTLEEKTAQMITAAAAVPRLGVPAYNWWNEALHGAGPLNKEPATTYPAPIGLAATFNDHLMRDIAQAIGEEVVVLHRIAQAQGRLDRGTGLDVFSPNLNIFRDPRWGRGQETYGEDPFLTSRMGVAYVRGIQGDDPEHYRVIATPKHFAVHSGPESTRHVVDVRVSLHDMADTYLPAFRAAVTEGHAGSIMCAYNSINGQPACANDFLLRRMLRGSWGFKGYVVSDGGAVDDIYNGHHFASSLPEAFAVAVRAGLDIECSIPSLFYWPPIPIYTAQVMTAVTKNLLTSTELDTSLRRLFEARIRLGLFDPPQSWVYANIQDSVLHSEAHRGLALKAARQSMVLLKNDGVLPLSADLRKIAVIGRLADAERALHSNYAQLPSSTISALAGIRRAFPKAHIVDVPGAWLLGANDLIPESALSTPQGRPGLLAEYFATDDRKGAPIVRRTEPRLAMSALVPPPQQLRDAKSARWSGYLTAPQTGAYRIGLRGADAALYIDDVQINGRSPSLTSRAADAAILDLEKGHRYSIRVEAGPFGILRDTELVWARISRHPEQEAVAAAKDADVVVAVVGITPDLEGEESTVNLPGFKGGDRTSLGLPAAEEDLLKAVKATGKPLIIVLINGSALAVNWAAANADAILEAWYPGEQGGRAIGEVLAGIANPAGRLPVTFYTGIEQLPPFDDYSMTGRTYRYFRGKPLFPFGFGLSYTSFKYDNLRLLSPTHKAGEPMRVSVDVSNVGRRDGDEVAELYLGFPDIPGAPLRALRAFERVHLRVGEMKTLEFTLNPRDLSLVESGGKRAVDPGTYRISVGGGQPGTGVPHVEMTFSMLGRAILPD